MRKVLLDGRLSPTWVEERVHLVPGFFDRTLATYTGRIAVLHLDCDFYDSYRVCLAGLYGPGEYGAGESTCPDMSANTRTEVA